MAELPVIPAATPLVIATAALPASAAYIAIRDSDIPSAYSAGRIFPADRLFLFSSGCGIRSIRCIHEIRALEYPHIPIPLRQRAAYTLGAHLQSSFQANQGSGLTSDQGLRAFGKSGRPKLEPTPSDAINLLLMTWAAGAMDALSYLRSGVFTANMTGNTVVLGLGLLGPERSKLVASAASLCAYAAGTAIAAVVLLRRMEENDHLGNLRLGLALELPFALMFGLLSWVLPQPLSGLHRLYLIVPAACALGIQSVALRRLHISGVVTTFITGTITTAIVSVIARASRVAPDEQNASPALLAALFIAYVLAAAAAAGLHGQRVLAPLVPLAAMAAVWFRCRRDTRPAAPHEGH